MAIILCVSSLSSIGDFSSLQIAWSSSKAIVNKYCLVPTISSSGFRYNR
uniref:Uncharacterized protein n=1 Tax=Arundo donax TaxID=35708 RepID=A0A0A9BQ64_ARUDO